MDTINLGLLACALFIIGMIAFLLWRVWEERRRTRSFRNLVRRRDSSDPQIRAQAEWEWNRKISSTNVSHAMGANPAVPDAEEVYIRRMRELWEQKNPPPTDADDGI